MTEQEVKDAIYRLSEQMSEELAQARLAYYAKIDEIGARYEPMLQHFTKKLPSEQFTASEFSVKLKAQKRSAA